MDKHIHKYIRVKIGNHIEYKCALAGCPHHLRIELVVGRFSLCNECGNKFTMTKYSIRRAKPKCENCIQHKEKESVDKLADLFTGEEVNVE